MAEFKYNINTARGILPFLVLFFSILTLFALLAYFIPLDQEVGWAWIILFLFLFFVGEPLYRRSTDRFEYHILLLEVYIFGAYFVQLFFPQAPYTHLFYVIPIFSAALSFGLKGTMLTSFAAFFLEAIRAVPVWDPQLVHLQGILPAILPLVILALMLGFTVELKNYTQQQLLNRLARMDAFRGLETVVDLGRRTVPFSEDLLDSLIELTGAICGFVKHCQSQEIIVSRGINADELQVLNQSVISGENSFNNGRIYRIKLPWEDGDYLLVLLGDNLRGILLEAEQEMVRALAGYLQHFIDYIRVQNERNNAARLREALIETVPLGIIVADEKGEIEEVNRAVLNLLSVTENEAKSKEIFELLRPEQDGLNLRDTRQEINLLINNKSIPVDLSLRAAKLGKDKKWMAVISDLRPLKKLQLKAERRRRMLALGEMAAGLAHEIRNPLGSLSGFVSLLDEKIDTGDRTELKRLSAKIRRSYRRIDRLIDQFIQYARQPDSVDEKFGLHNFCRALTDSLETPDDIEVNYQCLFPDGDVFVSGDRRRLEMALRNITLNAFEAAGVAKVKIKLLEQQNGSVLLSITDDGVGIDSEMKDKIFDPFVTSKEEGMGLGLALAQRVINEEFSGRIEINSTPGKGTQVHIFFKNRQG